MIDLFLLPLEIIVYGKREMRELAKRGYARLRGGSPCFGQLEQYFGVVFRHGLNELRQAFFNGHFSPSSTSKEPP
jgi:hypothetical protein